MPGPSLWLAVFLGLIFFSSIDGLPSGFVRTSLQTYSVSILTGSMAVEPLTMLAAFYVQFDDDLYFPSSCAPDPACTSPSILPCCDSCPSNTSSCHCSPDPGTTCLDASLHNTYAGTLPRDTASLQFSIGIRRDGCQDFAVAATPPYAFMMFQEDVDPKPFVYCNEEHRSHGSSVDTLFISVGYPFTYYLPVSFTLLVIETAPSQPSLLLPMNYFHSLLPPPLFPVLSCPGAAPLNITNDMLMYPSTDPALSWVNSDLVLLDVWQQPLSSRLISFAVPMWVDPILDLFPDLNLDTNLTQCVLRVQPFVDVTGRPFPAYDVTFLPMATNCSYAALSPVVDSLRSFIGLASESPTDPNFSDRVAGLLTGNAWVGCNALLSSLLTPETTNALETYAGCIYSFGTSEFAADPCCNSTVAYVSQCCAPVSAPTDVTRWTVNADAVRAQCKTPSCTLDFLSANLAGYTSLSPVECLAPQLEIISDPRLASSVFTSCTTPPAASHLLPIPCSSDSDCLLSGICAPDPLFVATSPVAGAFPLLQPVCRPGTSTLARSSAQCLVTLAHPLARLQMLGIVGLPSDASDDDLATAFVQKYGVDGCQTWGQQAPYPQATPVNGSCICPQNDTDCVSCNWKPDAKREEECATYGWRGDHFCSVGFGCDAGVQCTEVSRFAGCFFLYPGNDQADAKLCSAAGGEPQSSHGVNCWFSGARTQSACLPSTSCPASHLRSVASMLQTWCDPYCVLPTLSSSSSCSCDNTAAPAVCSRYGVGWDGVLGECLLAVNFSGPYGPAVAHACSAVGGKYWHGAFWQEDLYADKASCEARDLCTSDPGLFLDPNSALANAYTEAECTQLVGCDVATATPGKAGCASAGLCSSLLEAGRCSSVPEPIPYSGGSTCDALSSVGPLLPGAGCFSTDKILTCYFAPDTREIPVPDPLPEMTEGECLSNVSCLLPHALLLSSKSAPDCASCGGTVRPQNSWFPASWGPGVFVPFVWRRRSWVTNLVPATLLKRDFLLVENFTNPGGVPSTLLTQKAICGQQLQWNVLPLLACDCGTDAQPGCYSTPELQAAAQTVVCIGQASSFWPVISGSSPSFGLNSSGVAQLLSPASHPCTPAYFSVAQQQLFARPSSTPFSSLLLSTIRIGSYSILRNSRGVPFGQLRGDVVEINLGQQTTLNHSTLCLCDRGAGADVLPSSFSVVDFAAVDVRAGTFTPLFAPVFSSPYECQARCVNTTAAGTFAPVMRAAVPAETGWADLLSKNEAEIFLTATVLFAAFGALATYRLLSLLVTHRKSLRPALVALLQLLLLSVFCLLRAVLFGLLYTGRIPFEPSVGLFAFVEIPTMIEFSLAVFVAYLWSRSYYTGGEGKTPLSALPALAIGADGVLVAVLVCTMIALAALGPAEAVTACAAPALPPQAQLDRAYKVMVALIALLLGLLLAVYGGLNAAQLRRHGVRGFQLWQFVIVAIATVAGLLVQGALVFFIAFQPGTVAVLLLGAAAELVRPAALLLTARLHGWREDWCFGGGPREKEAKVAEYVMMQDEL